MLTLKEILAAKAHHDRGMPPGAMRRWAFLVTDDEIAALLEDIKSNPEYGIEIEAQYAADILAHKAALIVNGMQILPELLPPEATGSH